MLVLQAQRQGKEMPVDGRVFGEFPQISQCQGFFLRLQTWLRCLRAPRVLKEDQKSTSANSSPVSWSSRPPNFPKSLAAPPESHPYRLATISVSLSSAFLYTLFPTDLTSQPSEFTTVPTFSFALTSLLPSLHFHISQIPSIFQESEQVHLLQAPTLTGLVRFKSTSLLNCPQLKAVVSLMAIYQLFPEPALTQFLWHVQQPRLSCRRLVGASGHKVFPEFSAVPDFSIHPN